MTTPIWLIESGVYGPEIEPLAVEIRSQGMVCRYVTYRDILKGPATLPAGSCIIVYGTYPTVRHAMLKLGLRLVELNSFSCSWLYACDPAIVVAVASGLAVNSFERTRRA